jgi:transmembrane sensor
MTDEMHSLLGKYFSGQATAGEIQLVQQWVAASEQNRSDFDLLEKLWHQSGEQQTIQFDTNKAWKTVDERIRASKTPVRRMKPYSRAIAVAASLVLVFGMWWIFNSTFTNRKILADVAVKEVTLEDGSKVYLRKGSSLEYKRSFNKERREVSLAGQAFFEVTHDPSKPFVISAAQTKVEVVGTSFSVNTLDDKVELIVKTGKVKFGAATNLQQSILVTAGERALFAENHINKEQNRDENFDAWQTGQLQFNQTPLPQVLAVLNDYYHVNIRIRQDDAAQLSAANVTVRFNNQPLDSVLDEISLITSYRIQKVSDTAYEISIK